MCVDYHQLNFKTIKDAFPLPRIDESFNVLKGTKWFSSLDLASSYNQVAMDENDHLKTAFTTPFGLFEYNWMPSGLCNAPTTFQRLMWECLSNMFEILLLLLDNLILFSGMIDEHIERLDAMLSRPKKNSLKLRPKVCNLFQNKIQFLGHKISSSGIATDPDKVKAVVE